MIQVTVAIPPEGVRALRHLEREALDAEHEARVATDTATSARARADAVRVALCAALNAPQGRVQLDLTRGCFVVQTTEPGPIETGADIAPPQFDQQHVAQATTEPIAEPIAEP